MTKALELAKFGRETPPTGVVVGDSDTQTLSSKTFSDGPVFSSGTVNAVPYLNASKVFSTSGTFVFDGTNLGIGVASPSQKLDVYGADNQNAIISRNSGGSTSIRIQSNAAGNYLVGAGNVPVYLQSNSTTAITIDGSQNVGIGATSPADALNIGTGKKFRATHSASVYQQMFSSASGNFLNAYGDNFQITADSGAIYLTTVASQPIVFQTNGTDKLTILGTGNLGLGTAPNVWYSPTNYRVVQVGQSSFVGRITAGAEYTQILSNAYVDIYGAYKYINTGTATNFDMVNGEFRWSNKVSGTGGDSFSFDQKMTLNPSGNLGIGTISPNAKLDILGPSAAASPYLSKAIQFAPSNFPDRTWSLNYDDGGSVGNGFNISAGSTKIFYLNANGNVGIGTSSPENKLHVSGTSANNSSINTVVQNGAYKVNLAVMGSSYNYAGGYVNEGWLYTDSSNLCIGPHGNYAVKLLAGGEERMRVTSAGSVGIGTTDPQAKLQVAGTIRAASSGFQIGADKYIMQGSSYTGGLTDNDMVVVTSSQGKFVVWATDTGPVFNVKASGELVINEGGYNYDFRVESDNNENMLFVDASTNQIGIGNNTPNAPIDIRMDLGTAVTAAVRIRNTNTTARTSRLQFEDYAGIYADGLIDFKIPTAGVGASAILQMGVGGGAITMNQSGNVGIGTDNPARRLHVVGGAIKCGDNAGGARWTTDSWSRHIEIDSTNFGGGGIVWLKQDANPSRAILANNGNFYIARSTADDASAAITYDFSINSTGNVGIGTINPVSDNKLTIDNGANSYGLIINSSASPGLKLSVNGTNNTWIVGDATAFYVEHLNSMVLRTNDANRAILTSTGNLQLVTGNLVISTAGKGIDFSADPNAAGATSELLDDYEEGTFTPTAQGDSTVGTASYSLQNGAYVKVGQMVHFEIYMDWSSGTGAGNMRIGGLPFTTANNSTYPAASLGYVSGITLTANATPLALLLNSDTRIYFYQVPSGGGSNIQLPYDSAGTLIITGTYQSAS